ncbi:MAG: hypothetical protein Q9170_007657 [Blastenia crenularia]
MAYEYSRLSGDGIQIRLLTIEPADHVDDPLHVRLNTVSLASKPKYHALSYTWGRPAPQFPDEYDDPSATKTVIVDAKPFQVRYNLFAALVTLRQTWLSDTHWWVDALSIDQSNIPERNRQVASMGEIYAGSHATIVYLGPPDDTSDMAFSKIASLSESFDKRPTYLKNRVLKEHLQEYTNILRSEFPDEDSTQSWQALQSLCSRSWFQRAWVVQEFCVAPATLVQCGERMVTWIELYNTRQVIVQHCGCMEMAADFKETEPKDIISSLATVTQSWDNLMELKKRARDQLIRGSGLVNAMNQLRSQHATEPRDKVYAALGLAGIEGESTSVDYGLPIATIYASVAQRSMQESQSFHVLAYCHHPPKIADVPTWAPDWNDQSRTQRISFPQKGFHFFEKQIQEFLYHTTKESDFYARFDDHGRKMVVKAASFGEVVFVSSHGRRKYDSIVPSQGGMQAKIQDKEQADQAAMDYNAITLDAKWLREWAVFQSHREATSFPMINQADWSYNPNMQGETFKKPIYNPTKEDLLEAYLMTLLADVLQDPCRGHDIRIPSVQGFIANSKSRGIGLAEAISFRLEGKAFAVSDLGFIALVPAEARATDLIALVQGSELPFILRRLESGFAFIGQAYVHGIMDGQVWSLVEDGSMPLEEISII